MVEEYSTAYLINAHQMDSMYNHCPLFSNIRNQLNYFLSSERVIETIEDISYIRKGQTLKVERSLHDLRFVNYVVINNPNERKYYFYFVADKLYINEEVTQLILQLDLIQTHMFSLNFTDSFIEREHVQRWINGKPNINNLVEENFELGEYKIHKRNEIFDYTNKGGYIISSSDRLGISDEKRANDTGGSGGGGTTPPTENENEILRTKIINSARKLIGLPYVFGGNYPPLGADSGTDCSGLCQWAYNDNNILITRTTYTQINEGREIKKEELKQGDLIFSNFSAENVPEHVFLYSGNINGKMQCIEAPYEGVAIREREFIWSNDMRARRIIKDSVGIVNYPYNDQLSEEKNSHFSKVWHGVKEGQNVGLFPSITYAQMVLEGGWLGSELMNKYNNAFGIKADSSWTGEKVLLPTTEYENGVPVTVMAYFRVYDDVNESVKDRTKFLLENPRYEENGVFNCLNYTQQAQALQRSGYATEPNYAQMLINIIEENHFIIYDKV